ncbi:MAG: O-antigen ligase family protein [Actinobacteria bacterium]|nr:MAG: O-antigen ligase family protein [Actinomycetota bacterium]
MGMVWVYWLTAELPGGTIAAAVAAAGAISAAARTITKTKKFLESSMSISEHKIPLSDAAPGKESGAADGSAAPRLSWDIALTWLLGFVAVVYLGLEGGGYDALVYSQVGIVAWWVLLGTVLVGALPRRRPSATALAAIAIFAGFLAWTALSLNWTESSERSFTEVARLSSYLGFFALAILARHQDSARRMVAAVGAGIGVVALVALLSRLHPSWFGDEIYQTAAFLPGSAERLSYPLDYWNGLACLIAIGLPLLLQLATDARFPLVRGLAAAALPALMLTIYFTLSRGGIGAAVIGVVAFFAFTSDRLPKLVVAAIAGAGGAILIAAASSKDALVHGVANGALRDQGGDILLLAVVVCAVIGVMVTLLTLATRDVERPGWSVPSRGFSLAALAVSICLLLVIGLAAGAPGRASDAWSEFKESDTPVGGSDRLGTVAGESRYALWSSAVREMRSSPLDGTGAGTYEYWWNRDGSDDETVVDAHSMYLQVLGELGVVGFLIVLSFVLMVLLTGAVVSSRAAPWRRPALAAALAACVAFFVQASVDWVWQIPVLPIAVLLLAGTLVATDFRDYDDTPEGAPLRPLPRAAVVVAALALMAVIAIPLAATSLVRQSQDEANEGDVAAALSDARSAQNVEPFAATPRLQERPLPVPRPNGSRPTGAPGSCSRGLKRAAAGRFRRSSPIARRGR